MTSLLGANNVSSLVSKHIGKKMALKESELLMELGRQVNVRGGKVFTSLIVLFLIVTNENENIKLPFVGITSSKENAALVVSSICLFLMHQYITTVNHQYFIIKKIVKASPSSTIPYWKLLYPTTLNYIKLTSAFTSKPIKFYQMLYFIFIITTVIAPLCITYITIQHFSNMTPLKAFVVTCNITLTIIIFLSYKTFSLIFPDEKK